MLILEAHYVDFNKNIFIIETSYEHRLYHPARFSPKRHQQPLHMFQILPVWWCWILLSAGIRRYSTPVLTSAMLKWVITNVTDGLDKIFAMKTTSGRNRWRWRCNLHQKRKSLLKILILKLRISENYTLKLLTWNCWKFCNYKNITILEYIWMIRLIEFDWCRSKMCGI